MSGYDVIVVGSGSGGGTVVDRLSEDEGCRVLLLEAGRDFPDEATNPPAFYPGGALAGERGAGSGAPVPDMDWGHRSEPLPNGRRVRLQRGKLMGGSSMANGCVAVRARPADLDAWAAMGAEGWDWAQVAPRYERVEQELSVAPYPQSVFLPVQRLFIEASTQVGWRYEPDLNDPEAWDGVVGPWPRNRRNEVRQGSLNTYIRRARARANVTILGDALVERVLLRDGRGAGVRYRDGAGAERDVFADRVVLAAGAYGTAPILLRSGIGPAAELRGLGVEPLVDLPVGRGLLEHPGISMPIAVAPEHARMGWPTLAVAARGMTHWAIPMTVDQERSVIAIAFFLNLTDEIVGSITLASADPAVPPIIDHGYWPVAERGAFDGVAADLEALLATDAMREAQALDVHAGTPIRERLLDGLITGAHPAGGCAIGTVVDTDLQVLGVEGLTVADASVFPRHVTNNPNLTIHVIAEIAAARLRQERDRPQ